MKKLMAVAILANMCMGWAAANEESARGATARVSFYAHETDGKPDGQLTAVSLSEKKITIFVDAYNVSEGAHEIAIVVYGGNGVEAFHSSRSQRYQGGRAGAFFGYNFQKDDAPGTWWVVATLDGRPLTEQQIQVRLPTTQVSPSPNATNR